MGNYLVRTGDTFNGRAANLRQGVNGLGRDGSVTDLFEI